MNRSQLPWVYDIDRDVKTRLTTEPGLDHNLVWSPDGSRVVFDSHRVNAVSIYELPVEPSANESCSQANPK